MELWVLFMVLFKAEKSRMSNSEIVLPALVLHHELPRNHFHINVVQPILMNMAEHFVVQTGCVKIGSQPRLYSPHHTECPLSRCTGHREWVISPWDYFFRNKGNLIADCDILMFFSRRGVPRTFSEPMQWLRVGKRGNICSLWNYNSVRGYSCYIPLPFRN